MISVKRIKLKDYLKKDYPELSNLELESLLEKGACYVNGKIERFASKEISVKDNIWFKYLAPTPKQQLEIKLDRIIFEDNNLLAYNKEANFACMPVDGNTKETNLETKLKEYFGTNSIFACHRLDKNTSGVILFAKNKIYRDKIFKLFKERKIHKEYLAILDGKANFNKHEIWQHQLIQNKTKSNYQRWQAIPAQSLQHQYNSNSKLAITNVDLLCTSEHYSFVKLIPKTGRTHQLRIQSKTVGFPIIGDTFYAEKFRRKDIINRHLLHSYRLCFDDPDSQQSIKIRAPLDDTFFRFIPKNYQELSQYAEYSKYKSQLIWGDGK